MRLEIWEGKNLKLVIPMQYIPDSTAIIRECYETDREIIVCGEPKDENHNCDEMGCSTVNHVLFRFKKLKGGETDGNNITI